MPSVSPAVAKGYDGDMHTSRRRAIDPTRRVILGSPTMARPKTGRSISRPRARTSSARRVCRACRSHPRRRRRGWSPPSCKRKALSRRRLARWSSPVGGGPRAPVTPTCASPKWSTDSRSMGPSGHRLTNESVLEFPPSIAIPRWSPSRHKLLCRRNQRKLEILLLDRQFKWDFRRRQNRVPSVRFESDPISLDTELA